MLKTQTLFDLSVRFVATAAKLEGGGATLRGACPWDSIFTLNSTNKCNAVCKVGAVVPQDRSDWPGRVVNQAL